MLSVQNLEGAGCRSGSAGSGGSHGGMLNIALEITERELSYLKEN